MRTGTRRAGRFLVALLGIYLVGRAAVELVIVNPTKPQTYRDDWGGPHYLGVLLVHVGPGLLVVLAVTLYVRRRR